MGIIVRMMIWFKHRTGYVLNPPESTASKLFILYYVSLIEVNLLKKSNNIWSWQLSYPKRQMSTARPNPLVSNCKLLYSAHFMTHWHFETLFRSMNIGCSVTCDDNITELFSPFELEALTAIVWPFIGRSFLDITLVGQENYRI